MAFSAVFFGMALFLAILGVYAAISYAATQRTHEIGIRVALGAGPRQVIGLVARQGLAMAVVGVMIGLGAGIPLSRVIASELYGVSPGDPGSFALASALLVGVALLASFVPARRAARIEPFAALRDGWLPTRSFPALAWFPIR